MIFQLIPSPLNPLSRKRERGLFQTLVSGFSLIKAMRRARLPLRAASSTTPVSLSSARSTGERVRRLRVYSENTMETAPFAQYKTVHELYYDISIRNRRQTKRLPVNRSLFV